MKPLAAVTGLLERATAALLALTIVLGSVFLWVGIPALGMWAAGELTDTTQGFLFAVLGGVPLAMLATGWLLFMLGARYESLRDDGYGSPPARANWLAAQSEERASVRRAKRRNSLVEVSMAASATLALGLLLYWFFFVAETDLAPLP